MKLKPQFTSLKWLRGRLTVRIALCRRSFTRYVVHACTHDFRDPVDKRLSLRVEAPNRRDECGTSIPLLSLDSRRTDKTVRLKQRRPVLQIFYKVSPPLELSSSFRA